MHVQNFAIAVGLHFLGILVLKVEKILKGSLNSIPSPSPSVKIQIMGGKGIKAKYGWALSTNFLFSKVYVLPLRLKQTF